MKPIVSNHEQGTDEWRVERLGVFTASRAGDLMLRTKAGCPTSKRKDYIIQIALERITGELPEFIQTAAMLEGTERERTASLAYQFYTGSETAQTGFWKLDYYGASPDDLVGEDGGVEYKNPKSTTHLNTLKTGEIPEYYYWQIIQNLLVTGREWWDFVSYHPAFPPDSQLFVKRVNCQEVLDDIEALKQELAQAELEVIDYIKFIESYGKEK